MYRTEAPGSQKRQPACDALYDAEIEHARRAVARARAERRNGVIALALTGLFGAIAVTGGASVGGCNATTAQIGQTFTDGIKAATCIVGEILGGITDVTQLLSCSGATEQVIIDVINDFEQKAAPADGGAGAALAVNGGKPLTAEQWQWLEQAKANATARLAQKAPGK
jgi:hypothetical protein